MTSSHITATPRTHLHRFSVALARLTCNVSEISTHWVHAPPDEWPGAYLGQTGHLACIQPRTAAEADGRALRMPPRAGESLLTGQRAMCDVCWRMHFV